MKKDKRTCKQIVKMGGAVLNKAFTLIELLAVIVILAIIAIIATPIILGVIDDSKLKAKENSVNGLMDAVNMTYTKSQLTEVPLKLPITANINNGIITATDGTNSVEVTYTGEKPISGTIKIDGFGNLSASNVKYNDNYICTMGSGENGCTNHKFSVEVGTYVKKDSLDEERIVYYGEADNNYIKLKENGVEQDYRIVSIESDGTIKVIRQNNIKSMAYDSRTSETEGRRLNSNNTYCQLYSDGKYYGCNAWNKVNGTYNNNGLTGTVTEDSEINTYLNTTFYNLLDERVRNNIVTHPFNTTPNAYGVGLTSLTSLKNATMTWVGKIGLLELRDWFNATSNESCNSALAGSGWYKEGTTTYACAQNNYLHNSTTWWLMSPYASHRGIVFRVHSTGYAHNHHAYHSLGVRPVFYLSSNITFSGDGTSGNPYRIK